MYKKYNEGGEFPYAATIGGAIGGVTQAVTATGKNKKIGSLIGTGLGIAATALTGGAAAPLIPALSSLGGAVGGKVDNNKQQQIQDYVKLQKSSNMSVFAYGGHFSKPAAEVEGKEVMVTPKGNVKYYNGKSHEQGGIMVDRAGNPTSQANYTAHPYIYSNKINVNGKPASEVVAKLARRSNSYTDNITKTTINKVRDISEQTRQFYEQQMTEQEQPQQQYGWGSWFPVAQYMYDAYQQPSDSTLLPVKPPKDSNAMFTLGDKVQLGSMAAVGLTDMAMSFRKPANMHDRYMPEALNKTAQMRYSNEAENNRRMRNRASYMDTISNSYRNSNVRGAALSNLYAQDDLNTGMLAQQQQQIRNQILGSQAGMYMNMNASDKQTVQANWQNLGEQNKLRRDAVGTLGNAAGRFGQAYNNNLINKLGLSMVGTSDFKATDWAKLVSGRFTYPVEYMGEW